VTSTAFLAASGKVGFTSRLIFSTAKDWGPTAEKILDNLQIPVVRIGLSDLIESKVDWSQVFDRVAGAGVLADDGQEDAAASSAHGDEEGA
jgi:predicted helicase